ncbi:MAG: cysteine desulfurase family protein, partial [Cardiobacterium sp.]
MTDWAYFDYAATAPCEPQVAAQLAEDLTAPWAFANAGATYQPALASRRRLEDARAQLAAVIGADAREIVFTSGATEADNLALKGALGYHGVKQPHLVTVQTEHKAVLDPAGALAKAGAKITMLPVGRDGLLDLDALDEALATAPTLVSVMAVNNETGVVQPIADIAARVHRAGARLHVDAAQALGKLALDVRGWDVDMMSLSGHKIGAPVGIGALYVRRLPKMRLQAQQHGGGQERGRRSGTSPVALIRAFALAANIAEHAREARWQSVAALRATLLAGLPATM